MKLNKEILSVIVVLMVCSGNYCTCTKNPYKPEYKMSQQFKDYTLFKNGSWWIFSRENNSDMDTVTVIKSQVKIVDSRNFDYKWEQYLLHFESTYYSNDTIISFGDASASMEFNADYARYQYSTSFTSFLLTFFSNSPLKHRLTVYSYMETEYREFHDSILLSGIPYNNVKVFEILSGSPMDQRLPKVVYYAKNIGIIRKELWNGQVWNLVKQNIVQ